MPITPRESMNLLDASHPRLASLYNRMMYSARIFTPPTILIHPIEQIGLADIPSDTIILDPHYIDNAAAGSIGALIGHETGHLLSQRRPTFYSPASVLRECEQEADRIAVHLTGSHKDVSVMRQETNEHVGNHWRPSNKLGLKPNSLAGRFAHTLDYLSAPHARKGREAWKIYLEEYGTPEKLEANIRNVDLADRTHVDALITRRNMRTNPEMG